MVRTNTLVLPGMGAGVVRVKGTNRALALSVDGNGRYCYLDPYRGAMLAVVEAARNVACAGAEPIGATNCLNFGNPERPEIMWQFGRAVEGITAACKALDIPITGGNVSLYNETDGKAIYPTPVLGVVGLIEDASKVLGPQLQEQRRRHRAAWRDAPRARRQRVSEGDAPASIAGVPPDVDLKAEKALQQLLVAAAREGLLRSAHDCAEGGLAVTLAECAFGTGGIGLTVDLPPVDAPAAWTSVATLFSESASRVVVSVAREQARGVARRARRRSACRREKSARPEAAGSASQSMGSSAIDIARERGRDHLGQRSGEVLQAASCVDHGNGPK